MTPGRYAGAVSRLAAYVVDATSASALFSAGATAAAFLVRVVTGRQLDLRGDRDLAAIGLGLWTFAYFAVSWATTGMTPGMALFGIQVVRPDGSPAGPRQAVLRTLAFPLSVALLGLGFLGILVHAQRRALHDLIAGTAVVYRWRRQSVALSTAEAVSIRPSTYAHRSKASDVPMAP